MILYQKLINIPRMTKIVKESSVMQIIRAEYRIQNSEFRIQKSKAKSKKSEFIKSMSFRAKSFRDERGISFYILKYKDEISRPPAKARCLCGLRLVERAGRYACLCRNKASASCRQAPRNDKLFAVGIWMLLFGVAISGCNSQQSKTYDKSTMITYAELTLLYEKEKIVNKQTDSSYVIKVNEFFASKGLQQNEFKKKIETISQDDEEWKIFIQDVSTVMDSLKNVGK